jgi:RNA polymerase sigma-70 factor (ECF subfamily)
VSTSVSQLVERYRAQLPAGSTAPDAATLAGWLDAAAAAWPDVSVDRHGFVAHLARHHGDGERNLAELYLAFACAAGHARALAAFETYLDDVGKAIAQVGPVDRDDVLQRVREKLFVRGEREPLVLRFAGRGSLRAWLRAIVVRTALKQLRATRRIVSVDDDAFFELAAATGEPALEVYKQRYRAEFRASFRAAVAGLAVRDRNLLRHYFIDHLTIDDLGALYRVHRATAARWIGDVRTRLVDGVLRDLETRLAIGADELRDLIALVGSQLELSLERLATPVDE